MDGYPFVHREQVRFRDLDAMGHVNNAVYLTYMESARTALLRDRGLVRSLDDLTFLVARIEIDFRSPVRSEETVDVGVRPAGFGSKSFELEYRLEADRRLVAEGRSVCVTYDYETRETVSVPATWRERLAA